MEKEPKAVVYSNQFKLDVIEVYQYGSETFGTAQADKYLENIYRLTENLGITYGMYPECRHLPTKSKMYRWIILESHLIVYRIGSVIQVLRIIHASRSITKIKSARRIQP
jgi:plasmid stabilization system protein ParE